VVVKTGEMDGEMPVFWRNYEFCRNVWVSEKCRGSGEMPVFWKNYEFCRNIWVLEKCMGSGEIMSSVEMYGF
jgi:hypothetical protein